jgi:glycosyltransferase involved in cell wall biosynthesis
MKILILNWKDIKHPNVGGAEIIVYELAKRMVRDGHQVTWFCRNYIYGKSEETIDGINIVRRGNLITTYFYAPLYYWGLKDKPDIVVDMSNTYYWQTPLWALKSKRVAYLNQLAQEVFDYEFPKVISFIGKFLERIQYLTYKKTTILTYSESTKKDLISMGIPGKNIFCFHLGIDHLRYLPGKKEKYPLFLCVSRLVKMKRTDLVIGAMKEVIKSLPNAKLIISGFGYERKRLELYRNYLGLEKNVFFLDENNLFFKKDDKDAKVRLMRSSWALVFPSVKEGWGMTVTECAASGTPTIASDVTGLRDSVVDGKTGLLVSSNPTEMEIAKAMIKIGSNSKFREKLSKNAISWSKNFTWERCFEEFMSALNETKTK